MNCRPAAEQAAEACLRTAFRGLYPEGELHGAFRWNGDDARGELAANHALVSAAALGFSPAVLAERLAEAAELPPLFSAVTAAGGFLNFRLSPAWYASALESLCAGTDGAVPDFSPARFPGLDPRIAPRQDAASPLYRLRWAYERSRALLETENPGSEIGEAPWSETEKALLLRLTAMEDARSLFAMGDAFGRFYASCPIRCAEGAARNRRLRLLTAFCRVVEKALA